MSLFRVARWSTVNRRHERKKGDYKRIYLKSFIFVVVVANIKNEDVCLHKGERKKLKQCNAFLLTGKACR